MKIFGPFVLAALAAVHGVDAEMSNSTIDGPPHEIGGRMLSKVEDIAVPISRNTQACTSVAVLGATGTTPSVLTAMGMVNGEASCINRNYCSAFYATSTSQSAIMQELGNFDVLIILNGANESPPLTAGNKALVDAALGDGSLKGLMVYDRYANTDPYIPGLQNGDVVRGTQSYNEAHPTFVGLPPISGPFGTIGTFQGTSASHGYIKQTASVMGTCEQHLRQTANPQGTTTIQYNHGSGVVMYSTIPLDFYFLGSSQYAAFYRNTIFPNALCHLPVDGSPPPPPPTPAPINAGGDPHFKTFHGEHFEFHGQCDVVMASVENFANKNINLAIHLRTKMVRFWSYIESAAIRIGNDSLEVKGSAENNGELRYWTNSEFNGELSDLAGFPVTINPSKNKFTIDLDSVYPGQKIEIKTFKEFVSVNIAGATEESFGKSVGIVGDFKTGQTFARDGHTVLDDFNDLGLEWQVLPSDGKLFHEIAHPQFPELCLLPEDPRGDRARRLAESTISVEDAEAACASLKDPLTIKDCVYDILATQDMEMVGAF